ncbi:MAG TPA: UDP-2,4-diacetamido-2,4,6-trideoxy-beta-L-altropyranose hydrolase, partial [Cyanobacteria bacterium UBA9579]|nr:UDP-2,4-diacetamido-2,4,6-trideoxy-beta-L-altropyranose hydrolase [Cyanobacteria bacterium UBA9579]
KMAELMLAADLAIGAAGSTSWERCCLALPSIVISVADNQIPIAQALDKMGACIYLGTESTVTAALISKTLHELYNDQEHLFEMSKKAYTIVDGKGKNRVFESMNALL